VQTDLSGFSDGDFNLDGRVDANAGDLAHDLRWAVQVNNALVNAHLKAIPGVGTFTTRGLTDNKVQVLGWQTNWASMLELALDGTTDELTADCHVQEEVIENNYKIHKEKEDIYNSVVSK
jgi:hypothetical protein